MKPPSAKGRRIACPDLFGRVGEYDAADFRFRPAAYGIVRVDQDVLLARSRFTGLWDFPGGGVEPFEELREGMAREFFEETQLKITAEALVHVAESYVAMFGHPFHSLRFYYACRLADGVAPRDAKADPGEIVDLRWWPLEDIAQASMHETDRAALSHFLP